MNDKWPRWICASVMKHLSDTLTGVKIFTEGQERDTNKYRQFIEVRLTGPDIVEYSKDLFFVTLEVNVLGSVAIGNDIYASKRLMGLVQSAMASNILLYELGDDGTEFGCLIRENDLDSVDYGQPDVKTRLLQFTVEGRYRASLP